MRLFGKLALAFGAVALMAAPALAQQGRGGGGMFGGGGGMLLINKSVQTEIKATEDQVSKLTTFAEEFNTKQREARATLKDLSQEERQTKMREMMTKSQAEMDKALAEILKPEQVKRFHEIQVQTAGAMGITMGHVGEKLKLTDDQKTKIQDINRDAFQALGDLRQAMQDDREGTMKKIAVVRKETLGKVLGVLTAEQKTCYGALAGKAFEVKYEPRPN